MCRGRTNLTSEGREGMRGIGSSVRNMLRYFASATTMIVGIPLPHPWKWRAPNGKVSIALRMPKFVRAAGLPIRKNPAAR